MNGPRVLVVVASRHGATAEIADLLVHDLMAGPEASRAELTAHAVDAGSAPPPDRYDAVLLGSAVYAGRWLPPARDYAVQHAATLRRRPVWLFSSGPIGDPPFPDDEPHDVAAIGRSLRSRGHVSFPGRLDPARLGFGERAMVRAMRAPVGDFRDPAAVRAWAERVAGALTASTAPAAPTGAATVADG